MKRAIQGVCGFAVLAGSLWAKEPVPDQADVQKTMPLIEELAKDDLARYAKKTESGDVLGDKLIALLQKAETPAARYALLTEAGKYYTAAGALVPAFVAEDRLAELFDMKDSFERHLSVLGAVLRPGKPPAEVLFAKTCELFLAATKEDGPSRCARVSVFFANNKNRFTAAQTETFHKMENAYRLRLDGLARLEGCRKAFQRTPADPKVCDAYAEALVTAGDSWKDALPVFAKGSDAAVASQAGKEGADGFAPVAEDGDFWWKAGEGRKNALGVAFKLRAISMYKGVRGGVTGLRGEVLDKRVGEEGTLRQTLFPLESFGSDASVRQENGCGWNLAATFAQIQGTCAKGMPLTGPGKVVASCPVGEQENFFGGVLLRDGNVLLVPAGKKKITIYSPKENAILRDCPSGLEKEGGFGGGVLLPDGCVVLVPGSASSVCVYSPAENRVVKTCKLWQGDDKFRGGVLLPDGNVLFVPCNSPKLAVYSPVENAVKRTLDLAKEGIWKWVGAVLLPDGNVALLPVNAPNDEMLVYSPARNKIIDRILVGGGPWHHSGGCLLADGSVFLTPYDGAAAFVNPADHGKAAQKTPAGEGKGKYFGSVLLPNGDVLLVPSKSDKIAVYSLKERKIVQQCKMPPLFEAGGVLLPNGDVVLVPSWNPFLLVYRPDYGNGVRFSKEVCESPFLNKF